jgi:homopolymeric O-antigen transport system ATP-binding protein
MEDVVIRVDGISKKFARRIRHNMLYGTLDVGRGMLGMETRTDVLRPGEFWAVDDVSFDLKRGDTLGLIGPNGSGKSTLLRLLNGVYQPDKGRIEINGRVGALIAVGAGFHPLMTGRENIYLNGSILGMSRAEIDRKFDAIIDFADIGDFLDAPVKTYSSGMHVRLGFAIAIHCEPEILLVDEVLAVGDMFFRAKCMQKMRSMLDDGVALIIVSHATDTLKSVCRKGLLLNHGRLVSLDSIDKVAEKYFTAKVESEQQSFKTGVAGKDAGKTGKKGSGPAGRTFTDNAAFKQRASFQRTGNGQANFSNVQLLNSSGEELQSVEFDQDVTLRMTVDVNEDMPVLSYGYHIRDRNGIDAVYSGSNIENTNLISVKKGERYIVDWKFCASLMHGYYNIACILANPLNIEMGHVVICDFVPLAVQLEMRARQDAALYGLVHWQNEVVIENISRTRV